MTETAPIFDVYDAKREQLDAWVQKHLIEEFQLEPGRMLDVGCGSGFWAGCFLRRGWDVVGFDWEPEFLELAERDYPEGRWIRWDADLGAPPKEGKFDLVFIRAISHLYAESLADARSMLSGLWPALAPGGRLLLSAYSDGTGQARSGYKGLSLCWHHPHEDFPEIVRAAGYRVIRTTKVGAKYIQVLAA